jgi:predicted phosphodiesterase
VKLHILSDLHLEFGEFEVGDVDADAVILAGDTDRELRGLRWACEAFPDLPKLYVLGNHEFYRSATPKLNRQAQAFANDEPTLFLLDRSAVTIDGVRFAGATLWTDFALDGDINHGMREAGSLMNDFRLIRVDPAYRRLRPQDVAAWHQADLRFLRSECMESQGTPFVVITHHAPSRRSVGPRYGGDNPLNAAYASNLDDFVAGSGADLWVHGHTHQAVDYRIGDTRVLSNPRGYTEDPVPGFVADLVVEIPSAGAANSA